MSFQLQLPFALNNAMNSVLWIFIGSQLFSVLTGDMSFVGPRALLVEYLPRYTKEQRRRHLVKPGITGWAQVSGFRGGTETLAQMEGRVEHDVWHVHRACSGSRHSKHRGR